MHYYSMEGIWLYIVLVVPAMILAIIAQIKVKSTYKKYRKIPNSRGMTGQQAALYVLNQYGITDVMIRPIDGTLTDHYDPRNKVISLSKDIYYGTDVASVGIACHEAGHAAQHAESYMPIKVRNAILPACNIGSYVGIPIALVGYFLGFEPLIIVGLALYSLIAVFQLVTLPVEFDASARAMKIIKAGNLLYDQEVSGARSVLTAAAMTYVASLAVTLANLLRFILLFLGKRSK